MLYNSRDISLASQCQRIPAVNSDWFIIVFPRFTPVVVLLRFLIGSLAFSRASHQLHDLFCAIIGLLDFSGASHRLQVLADWYILHAAGAVISLLDVS